MDGPLVLCLGALTGPGEFRQILKGGRGVPKCYNRTDLCIWLTFLDTVRWMYRHPFPCIDCAEVITRCTEGAGSSSLSLSIPYFFCSLARVVSFLGSYWALPGFQGCLGFLGFSRFSGVFSAFCWVSRTGCNWQRGPVKELGPIWCISLDQPEPHPHHPRAQPDHHHQ